MPGAVITFRPEAMYGALVARYGDERKGGPGRPGHMTLLASDLGMSRFSVTKVFTGHRGIGSQFIGQILLLFPEFTFNDLFEVVEVSD